MTWKPISSAPRDGTVVILSGTNHNFPGQVMTVGKFNSYRTWECFGVWVDPICWHPMPDPPKETE